MRPEWLPRDIIAPVSEAERAAVRVAQRTLRVDVTGEMDAGTRGALRGVQYLFGLPVTGTLDGATANRIDSLRPWQLADEEARDEPERSELSSAGRDLRDGPADGARRTTELGEQV